MRTHSKYLTFSIIGAIAGSASARVIVEDFSDGMGGAAFDAELTYDFGTTSDFTGSLDTNDLFPGNLWLYADAVSVTVNSLSAGEYIESVEVEWVDFCGVACTTFGVSGATSSATQFNALVGSTEIWSLSTADIGEEIEEFSLSSFEGRIDRITVNVVPAPASATLLLGSLVALRRKR
jgi:hypothetical protein